MTGEHEVDACVIGGGVAGLSCARRLAQHGIDTVLLEAGTVAGGASGRNGGFLIAGTALFPNDARARFGAELAHALYARTLAAQEDIYALAAELDAGDALRRVGCCVSRPPRMRPRTSESTWPRSTTAASPLSSSSVRSCRPLSGASGGWGASHRTTARCIRCAGTGC